MNLIDRIRDILLPKLNINVGSSGKNKYSLVVDELVYELKESIDAKSTSRNLMFNAAYVVYVPPRYYHDLMLAFGVVTQEAVDRFHEILLKRSKRENKTIRPLCDKWSFDLICLKSEDGYDQPDENNPDSKVTYKEIEENYVVVRSAFVPKELYNFENVSANDELKTNRSQRNSNYERIQHLKMDVIIGLKSDGKGRVYDICTDGAPVGKQPGNVINNNTVLATLKSCDGALFVAGNNKSTIFDINLPDIYFGGKSASPVYQGKPMMTIDSEAVQSPHFELRCDSDGVFYIRAIGDLEVNQIPATRNKWTRLSDRNTTIKLNGNIEFVFNKK